MQPSTSLTPTRRFYELDLLRFLAAFEVMMFHYTLYGYSHGQHPLDFTALSRVLEYFYFGLELLFMLSGFVILKTVQNKSAFGFLSARMVRLYPTYWVCVTITAVVLLAANRGGLSLDLPRYLANLTMVQSALGQEHIDGVYWTMEVQIIFYAWIFLVCLVKQIHNVHRFLGLWLAATVFIHFFGGLTFTKVDYLLLPRLSFFFIAGGAFFLIYQRGRSLYLGSLVLICYLMSMRLAWLDPRHSNPAPALVGNTLLFLLFARMVLHDHRLSGKPWMVTLFKMTYPLYLLHQQVGYAALSRLDRAMPKYAVLAVVVVGMLLASYGIATQVEAWVTPTAKTIADRLMRLAGEPPAHRQATAPPQVAANAGTGREITGQAAIQASAESVKS